MKLFFVTRLERFASLMFGFIFLTISFAMVATALSFGEELANGGILNGIAVFILAAISVLLSIIMAMCSFMFLVMTFKPTSMYKDGRLAKVGSLEAASDEDDVVEGYRYAYLVVGVDGEVLFGALTRRARFGTYATARCFDMHTAPDEECTCGFYSLTDPNGLDELLGPYDDDCLLQVRLSGRVIESEKGNRAARQDVQCVYLPSECEARKCKQPTQYMQTSPSRRYKGSSARVLSAACEEHRVQEPGVQVFSVQQLRELLLTDVEVV